jgi:hypothetical protein
MGKSQLEVVNAAANQAARETSAIAPKQSYVKTAALTGAGLGAVWGAYEASKQIDEIDAAGFRKLTPGEKLNLALTYTVSRAAGLSAALANDQRGVESARERGVDAPNWVLRGAKGTATGIGVTFATLVAAHNATGSLKPATDHYAAKNAAMKREQEELERRLAEINRSSRMYAPHFGARCASYAARADAHERRARSRSARSATLHTERAAELRRRSTRHKNKA